MCDCHDLVRLGVKRLLNLGHSDGSTKVGVKLVDLGAIRLEAERRGMWSKPKRASNTHTRAPISEAVAEISRVEYQNAFPRLYEVGGDLYLHMGVIRTGWEDGHEELAWSHPSVPDPETRNG
jgi:hypothetical protein